MASGKGGTGKTTVAVNLALASDEPIELLDCDVEEPNAHLFFPEPLSTQEIVSLLVPEVDETRCDGCGECARFCQYHALVALTPQPMVFPELCHGCGGCTKVCPQGAIREVPRRIGIIETARSGHVELIVGRLDVGAPMAPPLVRAVKARAANGRTAILDAPPGTACPAYASLSGTDVVVLVTEPTPFGLHDLALAVQLSVDLNRPFGVVVNRVGVGDGRVHRFCRDRGIPILAEIPDDRRIAEAYSRGTPILQALPEFRPLFVGLLNRIRGMG